MSCLGRRKYRQSQATAAKLEKKTSKLAGWFFFFVLFFLLLFLGWFGSLSLFICSPLRCPVSSQTPRNERAENIGEKRKEKQTAKRNRTRKKKNERKNKSPRALFFQVPYRSGDGCCHSNSERAKRIARVRHGSQSAVGATGGEDYGH